MAGSVRGHHLEHVADFKSPASCQHHERDTQGIGRHASSRSISRSPLFSTVISVLSISFTLPGMIGTPSAKQFESK